MNEALKNIRTRNSPRELSKPYPSEEEMEIIYQAALRAPDHAWQRPSRFIQVTGKGLEKLSSIFVDFAKDNIEDVTDETLQKYREAPFRAPMIVILISEIKTHPKVPEIEQIISLGASVSGLSLHFLSYIYGIFFCFALSFCSSISSVEQ